MINLYTFPEMRLIASTLTDIYGYFYFVAQTGSYALSASSRGFIFPSYFAKAELLDSPNIYIGQTITISDAEIINYNIPMDPTAQSKAITHSYFKMILASSWMRLSIMVAGTVITCLAYINIHSLTNYFMLLAYMILWLIELIIESREIAFSRVTDLASGQPIDLALVRVVSSNGKLIQTYVSDFLGRVAIKTDAPDEMLLIERCGYNKLEQKVDRVGFIEGQKFQLEKIV